MADEAQSPMDTDVPLLGPVDGEQPYTTARLRVEQTLRSIMAERTAKAASDGDAALLAYLQYLETSLAQLLDRLRGGVATHNVVFFGANNVGKSFLIDVLLLLTCDASTYGHETGDGDEMLQDLIESLQGEHKDLENADQFKAWLEANERKYERHVLVANRTFPEALSLSNYLLDRLDLGLFMANADERRQLSFLLPSGNTDTVTTRCNVIIRYGSTFGVRAEYRTRAWVDDMLQHDWEELISEAERDKSAERILALTGVNVSDFKPEEYPHLAATVGPLQLVQTLCGKIVNHVGRGDDFDNDRKYIKECIEHLHPQTTPAGDTRAMQMMLERLVVFVPCPWLANGQALVDTPGTNHDDVVSAAAQHSALELADTLVVLVNRDIQGDKATLSALLEDSFVDKLKSRAHLKVFVCVQPERSNTPEPLKHLLKTLPTEHASTFSQQEIRQKMRSLQSFQGQPGLVDRIIDQKFRFFAVRPLLFAALIKVSTLEVDMSKRHLESRQVQKLLGFCNIGTLLTAIENASLEAYQLLLDDARASLDNDALARLRDDPISMNDDCRQNLARILKSMTKIVKRKQVNTNLAPVVKQTYDTTCVEIDGRSHQRWRDEGQSVANSFFDSDAVQRILRDMSFHVNETFENTYKPDIAAFKYQVLASARKHQFHLQGVNDIDVAKISQLYEQLGAHVATELSRALFNDIFDRHYAAAFTGAANIVAAKQSLWQRSSLEEKITDEIRKQLILPTNKRKHALNVAKLRGLVSAAEKLVIKKTFAAIAKIKDRPRQAGARNTRRRPREESSEMNKFIADIKTVFDAMPDQFMSTLSQLIVDEWDYVLAEVKRKLWGNHARRDMRLSETFLVADMQVLLTQLSGSKRVDEPTLTRIGRILQATTKVLTDLREVVHSTTSDEVLAMLVKRTGSRAWQEARGLLTVLTDLRALASDAPVPQMSVIASTNAARQRTPRQLFEHFVQTQNGDVEQILAKHSLTLESNVAYDIFGLVCRLLNRSIDDFDRQSIETGLLFTLLEPGRFAAEQAHSIPEATGLERDCVFLFALSMLLRAPLMIWTAQGKCPAIVAASDADLEVSPFLLARFGGGFGLVQSIIVRRVAPVEDNMDDKNDDDDDDDDDANDDDDDDNDESMVAQPATQPAARSSGAASTVHSVPKSLASHTYPRHLLVIASAEVYTDGPSFMSQLFKSTSVAVMHPTVVVQDLQKWRKTTRHTHEMNEYIGVSEMWRAANDRYFEAAGAMEAVADLYTTNPVQIAFAKVASIVKWLVNQDEGRSIGVLGTESDLKPLLTVMKMTPFKTDKAKFFWLRDHDRNEPADMIKLIQAFCRK